MKITAELRPSREPWELIPSFSKELVELEINKALEKKDYNELGVLTDREISPLKLGDWILTLNATRSERQELPEFLINRLQLNITE